MKRYDIDWSKIENCENGNKIKLDHLPKGGKHVPKNKINWNDSVGKKVYALYDNKEYTILLKQYDKGVLHIDIEGFYEINYKISVNNFIKCKIRSLINNFIF